MTFRERIRLATSALLGRTESAVMPYSTPPARTAATLLAARSTTPPFRAVTDRMATGVTMSGWHLYGIRDPRAVSPTNKGGWVRNVELQVAPAVVRRRELAKLPPESVVPIMRHPLLTMIRGGNPMIVGVALMEITQLSLDIVGEAFWMLESQSVAGLRVPYRAWPLPSHWVSELPSAESPTYEVRFPKGNIARLPAEDVIRFHKPDLMNPYARGSGIAASLGDELDFMEFSSKHIAATFLNRAIPPWVGYVEGAGDDALKKLQARMLEETQGFMKGGKPFLMNRKMDIKELAQRFDSLQLVDLLNYGRDAFVTTYGMQPSILGITEDANRANSTVANEMHARWNLDPRLNFLRATLQERLVPLYDDRLLLDYDNPIAEDSEFNRQVIQNHQWAFQMDEIRKMAGHGPDPSGQGHKHWLPVKGALVDVAGTPEAGGETVGGA